MPILKWDLAKNRDYVLILLVGAVLIGLGGCLEEKTEPDVVQIPFDLWKDEQIVEPGELAEVFLDPQSEKPLVIHVGYQIQYEAGYIPGAKYTGPASSHEGLRELQEESQSIPKDTAIVLYCGCCPWKDCPNVRPAFKTMQEMGFTNLKVLKIPNNFQQDWINKGYPIEKSD